MISAEYRDYDRILENPDALISIFYTEICQNLIPLGAITVVRRIRVGSSSDGFWSLTPLATRRLVQFSVIWSACTIALMALSSMAGSGFSLTLNVGYAIFALTLVTLVTGVFFLIRLTRLFLSIYRPPKSAK